MQHVNYPPKRLRFGVFEADPRIGELTKQGKRLPLQEQPFQLLAMLLERPGELVSREELRAKIWPQTIVDFDHGLNKAISKIRDALGDSAENPRFIETVGRRGYRFIPGSTLPPVTSWLPVGTVICGINAIPGRYRFCSLSATFAPR